MSDYLHKITSQASEATAAKVGAVMAYGGSGGAMTAGAARILGMTSDQWSIVGVMAGIVIGALGLLVNAYFKWREDQRRIEHWAQKK